MQYALLGDIHSSKVDLEHVLADIMEKAPVAIKKGTGDLFECTISKKNSTEKKFDRLEEVMVIPNGFTNLLDFDSVRGNQEERILLITESDEKLYEKLALMPETLEVGNAKIVHGHQWKWGGKPWRLIQAESVGSPVFFGHSHTSCLIEDNSKKNIEFGIPYYLNNNILVNVGAVVIDREWVLYDSKKNTATFMKVI